MANITVSNLRPIQNEFSEASVSYLSELTQKEINVTKGGFHYLPPINPLWGIKAGWAAYSYGKSKGWW